MASIFTTTGSPVRQLLAPGSGSFISSTSFNQFRLLPVYSSTNPIFRYAVKTPSYGSGAVPDWNKPTLEQLISRPVDTLSDIGAKTLLEWSSVSTPPMSLLRAISPHMLQMLAGQDSRFGVPDYHKPVLSFPQQTYEVQQPQKTPSVSGGGSSSVEVPPTPFVSASGSHNGFRYIWNRQQGTYAYTPSSITLSVNIQLWEGQTVDSITWARSVNGSAYSNVGSGLYYYASPNDEALFEVYRATVIISGTPYVVFWPISYIETPSVPFLSIEKSFPFFRAAYNFSSGDFYYYPNSIQLSVRYYSPSEETDLPSFVWFRRREGQDFQTVGTGASYTAYPEDEFWNVIYAVRASINGDYFTAFTDLPIVQSPPSFYMCSLE